MSRGGRPMSQTWMVPVWSARTVWVHGSLVDVHRALTPRVHVWVNVADDPSVKLNA